ncbi:MAG: prolipoprotein diacylglyceryl transferase [Myxococcota bacterium]|nr:prolipoprotein diacylglyceryl transferase [Myxococcota bacterium]
MIWDIDPTLIGPYELPWHGLFFVLEIAALIYVLWKWRKEGAVTFNDWSWLLLVGAGHLFYATQIEKETFDLEIRYYGLFFAIGLLGAARAFPVYFERWGFPKSHAEALTLWTPIGMLLGAHFIHLLFYETEVFYDSATGEILKHPERIIQLGSGLASHGGGLGAILAVLWFARKNDIDPMKYMDPSMCAATWVIPWVRVGNFFNSEIVGRVWDGPWAVAFPRHECGHAYYGTHGACPEHIEVLTRHPSQVYEAILAFLMLGLAIYLQRKWRNRLRPGAILFILLGYYFTTRFFIEYTKEYQTISDSFPFTMGQMLSAPIVLLSLYMLLFSKKSNIRTAVGPEEASGDELLPPEERAAAPDPDEDDGGDAEPKARPKKRKKRKKR